MGLIPQTTNAKAVVLTDVAAVHIRTMETQLPKPGIATIKLRRLPKVTVATHTVVVIIIVVVIVKCNNS